MEQRVKNILIILAIVVVVLVVIKGCQQVKEVKIKQKSSDTYSKLSVDVETQKEQKE